MAWGVIMKKEDKTGSALMAYRAEKALKRAVAKAIAEHKRNGIPIAVWRDGKVVRIPAAKIELQESCSEYSTSRKKR